MHPGQEQQHMNYTGCSWEETRCYIVQWGEETEREEQQVQQQHQHQGRIKVRGGGVWDGQL